MERKELFLKRLWLVVLDDVVFAHASAQDDVAEELEMARRRLTRACMKMVKASTTLHSPLIIVTAHVTSPFLVGHFHC